MSPPEAPLEVFGFYLPLFSFQVKMEAFRSYQNQKSKTSLPPTSLRLLSFFKWKLATI